MSLAEKHQVSFQALVNVVSGIGGILGLCFGIREAEKEKDLSKFQRFTSVEQNKFHPDLLNLIF